MRYVNKHPEYVEAIKAALLDTSQNEDLPTGEETNEVPDRLDNITQEAINVYLSHRKQNGLIRDLSW